MRKEPVISVIVTVHNAECYLRECIESVLRQTFSDIEILCMDGGSTDTSPMILEEYKARDERVKVVKDPNTSYGHKVNEGIRRARGKYISVLESDDMYCDDMLERLYAIAERYQPDFVNADFLEFFNLGDERVYSYVQMYKGVDYNILLESGAHPENMRQIIRYWTGLFRRDFLVKQKIFMNESPGAAFQDLSFRFLTSALAKTSYHLNEAVYLYRIDNPGSSVYNPKKAVLTADEFDFLKTELEKRKINNEYIWQHYYVWKYNDLYANLARFQGEARDALYNRTMQELRADQKMILEKHYDQYSEALKKLLELSEEDLKEEIEKKFRCTQMNAERKKHFYECINEKRIVVFGCGVRGRSFVKVSQRYKSQILAFTDNNSKLWGTVFEGYPVLKPQEAVKTYKNEIFAVMSRDYADQIEKQLQDMGISKEFIAKL